MQIASWTSLDYAHAFAVSLKVCANHKDARRGLDIHGEIFRLGLMETNSYVGSALVDMYTRCGLLAQAKQVFEDLTVHDTLSWNALMKSYIHFGHAEGVLKSFERMQLTGFLPDANSFLYNIKACSMIRSAQRGRNKHAQIGSDKLLETSIYVRGALIDMYAKLGALPNAQKVFDSLPVQNLVTWNSLISGYAEHGYSEKALGCLKEMQAKGMIPNSITMVYILKACSHMNDFSECLKLHAEIARKGFLEDSVHVATSLLDMYVKQGFLVKAQEIFDNVTVRNILSWTILIAGYADRGYGEKALYCFGRMQQEGFTPDTTVLACSLKGCGCLKAVDKGIEIHVEVERRSLLGQDSALANALLDMYVKCGLLAHAQEVLYELPHRDAASWTALIAGYAENGDSKEAFECFRLMQVDGINPNAVTLLCVLKACGNYGDLIRGLELHSEVERKGLKGDLTVANTLVDMYIKCGYPSKARDVFDSLPTCDVVSWNALISGYAELGHSEEVLACFEKMQAQDFAPDAVTYVGILKACASMGADISGRELHGEIARKGLTTCVLLGSALVDMYAKCGQLPKAEEVFETLSVQDVVSWNSLIAGYAQLGDSRRVFIVFDKMLLENVKPDMVTFLVVLTACNCRGLVKESGTYFAAMSKVFGIVPVLEHHSCMINLLGRNGNLNRVAAVIKEMPFCSNLVMWVTILNACKFLGNFSMAREAFQNALSLDDSHGAAYVLMSQVLANEN